MITEDYVSFEVAKLLKDKGFNEQCRAAYTNYGKLFTTQIQQYVTNILCSKGYLWDCTAPTLQTAMKWLREVHNIDVWVEEWNRRYKGCIHSKQRGEEALFYEDSYEVACEEAIKYCLENLI